MNKRMAKKQLTKKEEKMILKLFKACDSVNFYKFNSSEQNVKKFVKLTGTVPVTVENDDYRWFKSIKGKVEVIAFLK